MSARFTALASGSSGNACLLQAGGFGLLIDCGMDTPQSFAALEAGVQGIGITWTDIRIIVLTHMHPDHIGLSSRVRKLSGATVLMHEIEAEHLDSLEDEGQRLPYLHAAYNRGGVPAEMQSKMDAHFTFLRKNLHDIRADRLVRDGEQIASAIGALHVVCTPGHSPGHVVFLYRDQPMIVFGGDVLFRGGVGRFDFPNSNGPLLFEGIRTKLLTLPPNTVIYPGHGPTTTVGQEKQFNPFVGNSVASG